VYVRVLRGKAVGCDGRMVPHERAVCPHARSLCIIWCVLRMLGCDGRIAPHERAVCLQRVRFGIIVLCVLRILGTMRILQPVVGVHANARGELCRRRFERARTGCSLPRA